MLCGGGEVYCVVYTSNCEGMIVMYGWPLLTIRCLTLDPHLPVSRLGY
jgi:hypothetical protein